MFSDLQIIAWSSMTYNGEDADISLGAQNMVTQLQKDLKSNISKKEKPSGKTTPKLPEKIEKMKAKVVIGNGMSFGFDNSDSKDFLEPLQIGNGSG